MVVCLVIGFNCVGGGMKKRNSEDKFNQLRFLARRKGKKKTEMWGENEIDFDFSGLDMDKEFHKLNMPDAFLGRYTIKEIKEYLIETGIIERLLHLGFESLHYEIEVKAENDHRLYIYDNSPRDENMLVHLRVRHDYFVPQEQIECTTPLEGCHLLLIDWLRLQNPRKSFRRGRRPYPGQLYPGLGLMDQISLFIAKLAENLGLFGVFNIPEYFHDAMLFKRYFRFLNPDSEGKFRAILRDLRHLGLLEVSEAIHESKLFNTATGQIEPWHLGEQICPLKDPLLTYFSDKTYQKRLQAAYDKNHYKVLD